VKATQYFDAIRIRPDRAVIEDAWIERAVREPIREAVQTDGRIRRWAQIPEADGRYLRVVLLEDGETQRVLRSKVRPMRVRYFEKTDTLLIEFRESVVAETRDLDEDTVLDLDRNGNICAITVEHASKRTDIPKFSFERVAA